MATWTEACPRGSGDRLDPTQEGQTEGIGAVRATMQRWEGSFEDLELTNGEPIDAGDRVLVETHVTGRGRGGRFVIGRAVRQVLTSLRTVAWWTRPRHRLISSVGRRPEDREWLHAELPATRLAWSETEGHWFESSRARSGNPARRGLRRTHGCGCRSARPFSGPD